MQRFSLFRFVTLRDRPFFLGCRFAFILATALLAPVTVWAANSALIMDSVRGDWILSEQHRYYLPPEAVFMAEKNGHNGVSIYMRIGSQCWQVHFTAPGANPLQVGKYENAMRFPLEFGGTNTPPVRPGLDVGGGECAFGHGCNTLSGSFEVKELIFTPDGGIASFHATFVQSCEEHSPPLRGEIFYNSNDPLPPVHRILSPEVSNATKGQFFRYQVTSTERAPRYQAVDLPPGLSLNPDTGLVSGVPTEVGSSTIQLQVVSEAGTFTRPWTLVTTPAYEWTGPFTAIRVHSELGEPVGRGKNYFITLDDGTITGYASSHIWADPGINRVGVYFRPWTFFNGVGAPGSSSGYWGIDASAPSGEHLLPGSYTGTGDINAGARIYISQWGSSPWNITGGFTIFDIANDGFNRLKEFRGVFHQRSSNVAPLLHVWVWFNAQNVITSDVRANARQGIPFEYQIVANNRPSDFAATGLPPGLSLDTASGLISGVPENEGDFDVQLTASGAAAHASETVRIHVRPARSFKNIATRVRVGTGDNVVIGGFIITGAKSKRVLIRGIGASLGAYGLNPVLADPTLELYDSSGQLLFANDDWTTQRADIERTGLAPTAGTEAAIVASLPPGAYTTIVAGKNGSTGFALVEIYDIDSGSEAMFGNISTRGRVGLGPDDAVIGGLIIGGGSGGASRVVIRGIGSYGQGVPNQLYDPTLALHDGNGTVVASNDNWADTQRDALIATTLAPSAGVHAAVLVTLQSGNYTAVVRGKGQDQGLALVEAYNLDSN